ncbi:uncharacterized protein [Pocillopora verrucosa]|uniref:uncharacterized protein n=1 Tax=Pocillopora verrucosa TaxID=203993 RepID=UPI003340297A
MSLSNTLSLLFGELEPWVVITLGFVHVLIVSLIVLHRDKLTENAKPAPQIVVTPPSTDPSINENIGKEENSSSNSDIKTEPVTAYCSNGCQGACACPALESHLDIQRKSDPTLTPLSSELPTPPGERTLEPLLQSESRSMHKFRQKSTDEKLAIQYFKEKSQRESLNAGGAGTGGELDMGERRKSESKDSYKGKAASRSMPIFRKKSTDENKSVSYVVDKLHRKSDDVVGRRRESEFTTRSELDGSERRGSEGKKSTNKGRKDSWASDKSRRKSFDTGSVQSGSEIDGSERRGSVGSENYKTERKMNRFQKWRRRLSGAKKEGNKNNEDTSIEVTQRTSKQDRFFTGTARKYHL